MKEALCLLVEVARGEESFLLGTEGERGQERKIYRLVCLCKVPGMLLKVPKEPHEIIGETFGCE